MHPHSLISLANLNIISFQQSIGPNHLECIRGAHGLSQRIFRPAVKYSRTSVSPGTLCTFRSQQTIPVQKLLANMESLTFLQAELNNLFAPFTMDALEWCKCLRLKHCIAVAPRFECMPYPDASEILSTLHRKSQGLLCDNNTKHTFKISFVDICEKMQGGCKGNFPSLLPILSQD